MSIVNPKKNFRFRLEIEGIDQFLIQEVKTPDIEIVQIAHGTGINDADTKTPGKLKIGDLVVKKLRPTDFADDWVWTWLLIAKKGNRQAYSKFALLKEMDESGLRTVTVYDLGQIWPAKISGQNYVKAGDGENIIQEITFSITNYEKLPDIGI